MMRKSFPGPFWVMIVVGIVYSLMVRAMLYVMHIPLGSVFSTFSWVVFIPLGWVVLIFSEAIIYWRLRQINVYRKESWMHVGFLVIGLIGGPFLRAWIFSVSRGYYGNEIDYHIQMSNFALIFNILYWALAVVAHGFFVYVVRKCLVRRPVVETGSREENLLDDILH